MPMSETGDDPVSGRSGPLQELLFTTRWPRCTPSSSSPPARPRDCEAERVAARDAVACERAAAQRRIAQLTVSRGAALSEVAGLRAELERLGAEGAAAREELTAHSGNLGEAQRLLDDVRALADDLRGTSSQ
jgi:hypothetical protein